MSYYANITFFSHTHIIHGATVIHSHMHTDAHHNTKNGNHTEQSITLIAQLSHYDYIDFSCFGVPLPALLPLHGKECVKISGCVPSFHFQNLSLRAPPVVSLPIDISG